MALQTGHLIDHPSEHVVQDLAAEVEGALWSFDPLRVSNTVLRVTADDDSGVVILDGNVRGDMLKSVAGQLAARVRGVREVRNRLVSDPVLESDIAMAIALDPDCGVFTDELTVSSLLGVVYLGGLIAREDIQEAEAARDRAFEIAAGVPGVREVAHAIRVAQGMGDDAMVFADETEEEAAPAASGAKEMGSLIPEARREKIRAMIAARAAARGGDEG